MFKLVFAKGVIPLVVVAVVGIVVAATTVILASHEGPGAARRLSVKYIRCITDANKESDPQEREEARRECEEFKPSPSPLPVVTEIPTSSRPVSSTTSSLTIPAYPAAPAGYTQIYPGVYLRSDGAIMSLGSVFIDLSKQPGWENVDPAVKQAVLSSRNAIAHALRDLRGSNGKIIPPSGSTTSSVVSAAEAINRAGRVELRQLLPDWLVCWNSRQWWPSGYVWPF